MRQRLSGFTLIELLVVLTTIGLLAALFLPVFLVVREKARRSVCASNERQVGMAVLEYVADYDGVFSFGVDTHEEAGWKYGGAAWAARCLPYVRDVRVFQCPEDTARAIYPTNASPDYPVSYGINSDLHGVELDAPGNAPGRHGYGGGPESLLMAPTRTVMLFELTASWLGTRPVFDFSASGNGGSDCGATNLPHAYPCGEFVPDPKYGPMPVPRYATGNIGGRVLNGPFRVVDNYPWPVPPGSTSRHGAGAEYVACDGHAVWLPPERVSGGLSAVAPDCDQGTRRPQPSDCGTGQTSEHAAGTASGRYALTFSIQ